MTYCKNCGRESHCGSNASMQEKIYEGGIREIIICKHCRCKQCENKGTTNG